eukprot:SAG31_NODE_4785_length_2956_cov_23.715086_2_plen_494_part_00
MVQTWAGAKSLLLERVLGLRVQQLAARQGVMPFRECSDCSACDHALPASVAKKRAHLPFDFDEWYPQLSPYTWPSTILPFPPQLAQAFVHYYQARFNSRAGLFTRSDAVALRTLERNLDEWMAAQSSGNSPAHRRGWFIRMSSRSPKDGTPLHADALRKELQHELDEVARLRRAEAPPIDLPPSKAVAVERLMLEQAYGPLRGATANDAMVAYSGAQIRHLRVRSGREAMCLLLSSERVFIDLVQALSSNTADVGDRWQTSLILRDWDEGLRHDWEFRCFVCERRLTAISQYNHYCVFEDVQQAAEVGSGQSLRKEICAFWRRVQTDVVPRSYVMDICKLNNGEWKVIELNPFAPTTGGAMYCWRADGATLRGEQQATLPESEATAIANDESSSGKRTARIRNAANSGLRPEGEAAARAEGLAPLRVRQSEMHGLNELVEETILPFLKTSRRAPRKDSSDHSKPMVFDDDDDVPWDEWPLYVSRLREWQCAIM